MRRFTLLVLLLVIALPADGQHALLEPSKPIGVGWKTDKWGWMSFVAFSPDGKQVASDGATEPTDVSGNLSFWSFPEGRLVRKIAVNPIALSENWEYYASFHGVGNVRTGKSLISLGDKTFAIFAFSPDSHLVAESRGDEHSRAGHIQVFTLPSLNPVISFGRYAPHSLAISPDEVTLASGYWGEVILWNVSSGKSVGVLRGFGRYVEGLSFSKDGAYIAAGTDTGDVEVWDLHQMKRMSSVHLGGQYVSNPAFSPDGTMVAVGLYGTGTVWLIDTHTGEVLDHKKVSDLGCGSVAFSPDGKFVVTPSTGGIVTWPYDRGGTIRVFRVSQR